MSDSEHDWLRPEEETESETIIDARTAQNNPKWPMWWLKSPRCANR